MKKVLFVDDEMEILDGMRNSLRKYRKELDLEFAQGAVSALEILDSREFDILVTDMRMPQMDGTALLAKAAGDYPLMARMLLTGYADNESLARGFSLAHRVLSKPCDGGILLESINQICRLQNGILNPRLRDAAGKIASIPSASHTFELLMAECIKPVVDPLRIAAIIALDPGLCARLLKIARSTFFSSGDEITNLEQAVNLLGLDKVRSLIVNQETVIMLDGENPAGFSAQHLQHHSLQVALLARGIAPPEEKDMAFTAGLLHDIGHHIVANIFPDEFKRLRVTGKESGQGTHLLERREVGFDHSEIGALLLNLWGLPQTVVEIVEHHHHPSEYQPEEFGAAGAVHIADALVNSFLQGACDSEAGLDMEYIDQAGLRGMLPHWRELARRQGKYPC